MAAPVCNPGPQKDKMEVETQEFPEAREPPSLAHAAADKRPRLRKVEGRAGTQVCPLTSMSHRGMCACTHMPAHMELAYTVFEKFNVWNYEIPHTVA